MIFAASISGWVILAVKVAAFLDLVCVYEQGVMNRFCVCLAIFDPG